MEGGMKKCCIVTFVFLFILFTFINLHAAQKPGFELNKNFLTAALTKGTLPAAVQLLLTKDFPVQMIIDAALEAGYGDAAITRALFQSSLPIDKVVINTLQSHMMSKKVLTSLQKQGLDPATILQTLLKNQADINCILSTFQFILNQDETKYQAMEMLINAGADRDTILRVAKHFNVPPATVLEAYRQIYGDFGQFGHVYNRHSKPKPALLAVGVARINNCDACRNRPVISPHRP